MFRDLFVLINLQQDLIDNIEQNVGKAGNYTEKAVENLRTAKTYSSRAYCVRIHCHL